MPFIHSSAPVGNQSVEEVKRARQEAALWAQMDIVTRSDSTYRPMRDISLNERDDERAMRNALDTMPAYSTAPLTTFDHPQEWDYDHRLSSRRLREGPYHAVDPYAIAYAAPHPVAQVAAQPVQVHPPPGFSHLAPVPTVDRIFAFSPSSAYPPGPQQFPAYSDLDYQFQAPVYSPRDVHRYPQAKAEPVYEEPHTPEMINDSFARWYVDEVINYLLKPGQYRIGTGGQSEEIWGVDGRARDCFDRVGIPFPDVVAETAPWERVDMSIGRTVRNVNRSEYAVSRHPEYEIHDPYRVTARGGGRSDHLVSFIVEILGRMAISPTAVVNAVWFVRGLGLHQGDGEQGSKLRNLLYEQQYEDRDAVAKRVAMLGLILAGKWLDDNSFLTKSW